MTTDDTKCQPEFISGSRWEMLKQVRHDISAVISVMKISGHQRIRFGTDGWRGIIAKDFTFKNVGIAAQAIADYVKSGSRQEGVGSSKAEILHPTPYALHPKPHKEEMCNEQKEYQGYRHKEQASAHAG